MCLEEVLRFYLSGAHFLNNLYFVLADLRKDLFSECFDTNLKELFSKTSQTKTKFGIETLYCVDHKNFTRENNS